MTLAVRSDVVVRASLSNLVHVARLADTAGGGGKVSLVNWAASVLG